MSDEYSLSQIEEKVLYLIERERYDQAGTLIKNGLKSDPNNSRLLYYLACVYADTDQSEEAEITLQEILQKDPEDISARFLLASVYKHLSRFFEAEALIIELIRQNPESSDFYTLYAEIMLETLHLKKAGRLAKEAIRFEPDNISAQAVAVICEVIKRNKTEYQEQLFELVRNHPEAYTTASIMIVVLNEQKKHKEALRLAQELLRSNPKNESIVDLIKELRVLTHPTLFPLWPVMKYGWHASAILWALAIVMSYVASNYLPDTVALIVIYGWLLYVIYSWVYPPLLRKIMN